MVQPALGLHLFPACLRSAHITLVQVLLMKGPQEGDESSNDEGEERQSALSGREAVLAEDERDGLEQNCTESWSA